MDKWKSLVDRVCVTCGAEFKVQYQSTKRSGGAMYCTRQCNPNFNAHLKKAIKNPLGAGNSIATIKCPSCNNDFEIKIRNINRGGGVYCSKKCNPSYAAKYERSVLLRRRNLKKYGLSIEKYQDIVESINNKCQICGKTPSPSSVRHNKLSVDHDHVTGQLRGLICHKCNVALGLFCEDVDILNNAIQYLNKYNKNKENMPDNQEEPNAS